MFKIIQLLKNSGLEEELIKWAGLFRYLNASYKEGFSINEWMKYYSSEIDRVLIQTLFRTLEEEKQLLKNGSLFKIKDDNELQRYFETAKAIIDFNNQSELNSDANNELLWTIPSAIVSLLPSTISKEFKFINTWIQNLIQTAQNRVLFFSPYYSIAGIQNLMISLNALISNKENVIVDVIVSDLDLEMNSRAIDFLIGSISLRNNNKLRVFEPKTKSTGELGFHAKLLLIDSKKGYMGSANFSERALNTQFELGVSLDEQQTSSLTALIDFWIEHEKSLVIKKHLN
ncbi:phospholipase D-like domain-containing protein [Bacillus subtilis]